MTIDTATRFQTVEGFGTCLPWWINDPSTSPLYDPTLRSRYVKDLGFNILRVEMHPAALMGPAGTLDSRVDLVDDVATNLPKFNMTRPPVKLYGDFAQYVRDNVLEPGTFKLVGAFWSPPHWLKGPTTTTVDGKATPFLNDAVSNTCGGRLLQDDATKTQFARYVGAWIRGFEQQYGVTWAGVSLQNELIYETSYNSCNYGSDQTGKADQWWQYADALKAVSDYLKAKSITTPILGPHHASIGGSPQNPWHLYEQMGFIDAVRNHASGNLMSSLGIFASNDYFDGGLSNHAVMMRGYWEGTAKVSAPWAQWAPAGNISQYGKENWFQETSGEANTWDRDNALGLAQKIHDALVFGNASAYIYWLINDDQVDVDTQTLLGNSQLSTPTASKKYCAMKHFSRYIRPGAQRVKATFDSNGWTAYGGSTQDDTYNSLNVSAYLKGSNLTIVLLNMRSTSEPTTIAIPASLGITTFQSWRTSSSDSFAAQADLAVGNNQITVNVPAYSVVTLTGQGGVATSYALVVMKNGAGSGTVTSTPAGVSCGSACSASYDTGTVVTLTAAAAGGSTFGGWSGACSGTGATCTVTMSQARAVTATFNGANPTLTITKAGTGAGTITSSSGGISCDSTCSASYTTGTVVTLTAAAASGSTFGGWSGVCTGTATTCTVTMSASQSVTAAFAASGPTLTVAKAGTGAGVVTSSTGAINCGSTCSAAYTSGTVVTLTATATSPSTFGGWSVTSCGTNATCAVTVSASQTVTATFNGGGPTACANPITFTGNTGNFNTTGAVCYRTSQTVNGWGCFNIDGRTVSVNGGAANTICGFGPLPLAKSSDGYTYFYATAGTFSWAGIYLW